MNRLNSRDSLVIAVRARMIVGPTDRRACLIVANVARLIGLLMLRVKEMRATDSTERTQRRAQVFVVARRQNPAASLVKTRDAFAVGVAQSVAGINSKKPELVDIGRVKHTQNTVIAFQR